ncbi:uncharacterized protein LOC135493123 isoform X2 [Lineus longissimus]|uniref:uncharacterized protein LOC135493123 isoform X2 n=1 Tax=Lineus longissimus TaxID=88925 RepID=UPI00315CA192
MMVPIKSVTYFLMNQISTFMPVGGVIRVGSNWPWIMLAKALELMVIFLAEFSYAKEHNYYAMDNTKDCSVFMHEEDGATIKGKGTGISHLNRCELRFDADVNFHRGRKFQFQFKSADFDDCDVELKVYNGYSDRAGLLDRINCDRSNPQGILYKSNERFLMFQLQSLSDNKTLGLAKYQFEIVITGFSSPGGHCASFLCQNLLCISDDLECDKIDHCFDETDEYDCDELVLSKPATISISVGCTVFVLVVLSSSAGACYRRRQAKLDAKRGYGVPGITYTIEDDAMTSSQFGSQYEDSNYDSEIEEQTTKS